MLGTQDYGVASEVVPWYLKYFLVLGHGFVPWISNSSYIVHTRGQAMDSFAYPTILQCCEILPKLIEFHVASQEIALVLKI